MLTDPKVAEFIAFRVYIKIFLSFSYCRVAIKFSFTINITLSGESLEHASIGTSRAVLLLYLRACYSCAKEETILGFVKVLSGQYAKPTQGAKGCNI